MQTTRSSGSDVCDDLNLLHAISERMCSQLKEHNLWNLFITIEAPLTCILALLELRGICVDLIAMKKSGDMLQVVDQYSM